LGFFYVANLSHNGSSLAAEFGRVLQRLP
jgi:hypothetical protein